MSTASVTTSLTATKQLIEAEKQKALLLLSDSAFEEFRDIEGCALAPKSGQEAPSDGDLDDLTAVVVGLAPERLHYTALDAAMRVLIGCDSKSSPGAKHPARKLYACHTGTHQRGADGFLHLGPGPFVRALAEAAGAAGWSGRDDGRLQGQIHVVGKPSLDFFQAAVDSLGASLLDPRDCARDTRGASAHTSGRQEKEEDEDDDEERAARAGTSRGSGSTSSGGIGKTAAATGSMDPSPASVPVDAAPAVAPLPHVMMIGDDVRQDVLGAVENSGALRWRTGGADGAGGGSSIGSGALGMVGVLVRTGKYRGRGGGEEVLVEEAKRRAREGRHWWPVLSLRWGDPGEWGEEPVAGAGSCDGLVYEAKSHADAASVIKSGSGSGGGCDAGPSCARPRSIAAEVLLDGPADWRHGALVVADSFE